MGDYPLLRALGIVFIILGTYIISIGPMYWLANWGVFGDDPIFWLADIYAPIWWFEETPLRKILYWYVRLGMD